MSWSSRRAKSPSSSTDGLVLTVRGGSTETRVLEVETRQKAWLILFAPTEGKKPKLHTRPIQVGEPWKNCGRDSCDLPIRLPSFMWHDIATFPACLNRQLRAFHKNIESGRVWGRVLSHRHGAQLICIPPSSLHLSSVPSLSKLDPPLTAAPFTPCLELAPLFRATKKR